MMLPALPLVCLIALLPISSSATACPPLLPTTTRIIGGTTATPDSVSYTASIINAFSSACTASLLSPYWLLTARHCEPTNSTFIFLNTTDRGSGILRPVKATYPFQSFGDADDIALIELAEPAPSDLTFVKINTNASLPLPNAALRSSGFGFTMYAGTASEQMRQVDIPARSMDECLFLFRGTEADLLDLDFRSICGGYFKGRCGVCNGDSGGPLVQLDADGSVVQVGITSRTAGCAWAGLPALFVRVSEFVDWMREVGAEFETSDQAVQTDSGPER
eukprot:GFKZ01001808.1.p1 GENE.GFKZ01001808.1~~GFKZ01001808.1.p1  ORF type:complete len:277 (-),score=21.42 GFKZ01001808.1:553-1383(-)